MKLKKEILEKLREPKYAGLFISKTELPISSVLRWLNNNYFKLKLYEAEIREILEVKPEDQIFEK